jgi:thiamine-monophosphate kinase
MTEFNLIQHYFTRPAKNADLGVGDDAALIQIQPGHQLAVSVDMLVAGTHFFENCPAFDIGWKSLAVNISDMSAMGAAPKWATLAIALPQENEDWLAEFSRGFFACADDFNVSLIGGDTTRGPLNISVQIMGEVPIDKALRRDGATHEDKIWVSGTLGMAALGLAHLQEKIALNAEDKTTCIRALQRPQARVALGLALRGVANSAIDISDGLLADLGHILKQSKVGATLYWEDIPKLKTQTAIDVDIIQETTLAGGDDYELCFTAPAHAHDDILEIGKKLNVPLRCIGITHQALGLHVLDSNQQPLEIKRAGYDHFK